VARVTTIPATISRFTATPINEKKKRRTAAYARVSTDSEEQLTSYTAQVDYYTQYIRGRDDWEFVEVYTDEGITRTNTKHREGFKRMVADALAGKIDLIVTKSVSRFARNTVDSLTTVRQLKEKGVEIYFEKENIWTLDSKGELLITIMSSLAQEESRSISENVTWGQRKRFADGKVSMPYKQFLGYDRGEGGVPVINEKEAEIVRLIYRLFLEGKTASGICKYCQPTSQGLAYVLVGPTDSYKVNGIGSCTDTTIIIPSTFQGKPVTSIASRAFEEQKKITNVVIPSTITTIGDNAFYGCIKLKSVTIPESVTKIGNSAFERCSLLKSVTFENTEGWAVSENGKPEGATDISAADLADVAKAAELLRLSSTGYTKMAWFIKES